jgi:hypothetical protein
MHFYSSEEFLVLGLLSYGFGIEINCFFEQIRDETGAYRSGRDFSANTAAHDNGRIIDSDRTFVHFLEHALRFYRELPDDSTARLRLPWALNFFLRGCRHNQTWLQMSDSFVVHFTAFEILVECVLERFALPEPLLDTDQWQRLRGGWTSLIKNEVGDRALHGRLQQLLAPHCRRGTMATMKELIDRLGIAPENRDLPQHLQRIRSSIVHNGKIPPMQEPPVMWPHIVQRAIYRLIPIALGYDNDFSKTTWISRAPFLFDRFTPTTEDAPSGCHPKRTAGTPTVRESD